MDIYENKTKKQKWDALLNVILSPGSSIFLILTAIGLFLSFFFFTERPLSDVLTVSSALSAALAGSFMKDDWEKARGNSILEKKGISALRNLKSVSFQIEQLKTWVKAFISQKGAKSNRKRDLEELIRHLGTLKMNVEAGEEDWIDLVPKLKERALKKEEMLSRQQETIREYVEEIINSKKKLLKISDKKEKQELKETINELEENIKDLRKERYGIVDPGGLSFTDTIRSTFSLGGSERRCMECGEEIDSDKISPGSIVNVMSGFCDKCLKKGTKKE